ncbi:MAG: holo-ACP synthase [Alphaproteobacteria bacterium]|jgi:holo-[acyl-carrier protein] synthase|nr:holo-ACP synthase [Alphaproteobacteria bacterium]
MIIGIGNDIVDIDRIARTLERFGERFINRVFTADERDRAEGKPTRAAIYAKRFAAKEAVWKALGEGNRLGVAWRELAVSNVSSGKPLLTLTGAAAQRLASLTPKGMAARLDLSLSDEPPLAQAFVVISAEPEAIASFRVERH